MKKFIIFALIVGFMIMAGSLITGQVAWNYSKDLQDMSFLAARGITTIGFFIVVLSIMLFISSLILIPKFLRWNKGLYLFILFPLITSLLMFVLIDVISDYVSYGLLQTLYFWPLKEDLGSLNGILDVFKYSQIFWYLFTSLEIILFSLVFFNTGGFFSSVKKRDMKKNEKKNQQR